MCLRWSLHSWNSTKSRNISQWRRLSPTLHAILGWLLLDWSTIASISGPARNLRPRCSWNPSQWWRSCAFRWFCRRNLQWWVLLFFDFVHRSPHDWAGRSDLTPVVLHLRRPSYATRTYCYKNASIVLRTLFLWFPHPSATSWTCSFWAHPSSPRQNHAKAFPPDSAPHFPPSKKTASGWKPPSSWVPLSDLPLLSCPHSPLTSIARHPPSPRSSSSFWGHWYIWLFFFYASTLQTINFI